MTFDELYRHILEVCPNAQTGEGEDGELIIYTGMRVDKDNVIRWLEND